MNRLDASDTGTSTSLAPEKSRSPAPQRSAPAEIALPPGDIDYHPPLLSSFSILSGLLGRPLSKASLKSGLPQGEEPIKASGLIRAAEKAGMTAKTVHRRHIGKISPFTLPCILVLKKNNACVLTGLEEVDARVIFPEQETTVRSIPVEELQREYSGYAIFARQTDRLDARTDALRRADGRTWFWGTIRRFAPIYGHVVLATVMVNILGLAGPLFVMNVYDRVVPNNAVDTLWVLTVGVLIAYSFDFLLRNLRGYFVDVAGKSADVIIASKLMQQVTAMKLDRKPDSAGSMANNLREFESLREFFSSTTLLGLVDMPFIFIFIAIIAYIGGPLAWAPLMAVPMVLLVGIALQYPFQRIIEKGYREAAMKNALLFESIGGLETVKTSQAEGRILEKWEKVVGMNARTASRTKRLANFSITFSQFAAHLVSVIIILAGVYQITAGRLTMGGLIACMILSGRAMAPLGTVAAMLTRLQQSRMALRALDELMKLPSESPHDRDYLHHQHIEPSLTLEKVEFQYPDAQTLALKDVTLHLKPGEKVAVIGRTGSGKSTLGRLCLGLYSPREGKIKLGGIDIRQLHVADLRTRTGYVSQDNFLFHGTIRDNIALGASHVDDRAIVRAATIAGVTDFVRTHPAGFNRQVGERGSFLSGGQRQAVAIARALLPDPEILILDEPTSAMDQQAELLFCKRLSSAARDKTLVIFTHRSSLLRLVDRLVVLDGGRLIADGPKEEVLQALKDDKLQPAAP